MKLTRGTYCTLPFLSLHAPAGVMETMPQQSTNAYDYLLKILLVGDTKSNKKALLGTYLEDVGAEQRSTTTLGGGGGGSLCVRGGGCVYLYIS